jgi:hypothetical protein
MVSANGSMTSEVAETGCSLTCSCALCGKYQMSVAQVLIKGCGTMEVKQKRATPCTKLKVPLAASVVRYPESTHEWPQ